MATSYSSSRCSLKSLPNIVHEPDLNFHDLITYNALPICPSLPVKIRCTTDYDRKVNYSLLIGFLSFLNFLSEES